MLCFVLCYLCIALCVVPARPFLSASRSHYPNQHAIQTKQPPPQRKQNADVRIDQLNGPDAIISGFAPELFGRPLDDGDVLQTDVVDKQGIRYYEWALKPHNYVSATAVGNRVFILSVAAKSSRSWAKHQPELRRIQQSFWVPPKGAGSA